MFSWSTSQSVPSLDTALAGGQSNVSVTGTFNVGVWAITIVRPIAASDVYDTAISTTGS